MKIQNPIAVIGRDPDLTLAVMRGIARRQLNAQKKKERIDRVKAWTSRVLNFLRNPVL